ncbi:YiiD C-terminal domain-containing protein [Spirochaeta cellobiosiphila]|uniref:YiiD C-terminal domain-containing protein n=1 Tax=Spirochaeta cellobiosiphila TaxID=504483 RepID=UPI00055EE459|nr:YiiD C-terminal domain-containing protein [Spirochaeta cellobiosiphila]
MKSKELLKYLNKNIPITKRMDLTILESSSQCVAIKAGLEANRNHKKTAFGGSINTLMVLSCFSLLKIILDEQNIDADIVIQRSQIEFLRPVQTDFTSRTRIEDQNKINLFIDQLQRHGKGRIGLQATISQDKELAAFKGDFVAMLKR